MVSLNIADLPNVIIGNASSVSTGISVVDDAYGISLMAPATLTASQVTVQVAMSSNQSPVTLLSGGSAVVLAAGQGIVISPFPYRWLSLISTSVEGAARTFTAGKVILV